MVPGLNLLFLTPVETGAVLRATFCEWRFFLEGFSELFLATALERGIQQQILLFTSFELTSVCREIQVIFMSYQTTESKKQEFRKYLEKTGVIDHLTRALVGLYQESDKPNNSIDFLKKNLGAPVELDTLKLKSELDRVKDENTKLRKELEQYRKELQNLKQEDGQD